MTLVPEKFDVEEVERKLKELEWEDIGLKENELLENYIHDEIFEKVFYELNEKKLKNLTEREISEVIGQVKDRLKASEDNVLEYLKHGVTLKVRRRDITFILIDFNDISRNIFFYGREIKFKGTLKTSNLTSPYSLTESRWL